MGTKINYLWQTTAAGNRLAATIKYLRGASLGTMIKYLRRTRNGAAGSGLGITIK
jgi:hypothetical protein